ncbi:MULTISPECIES: GNAT family N-acetyltransferase [Bacillus]|uniref:GNAT family N-acetyltransferase n=1 Tax=Bacillus TaxID=1386 RepID=UPI001581739D|nr:GNAT family N-acetyltransferase [Bacillus glycinifermentans]MBU8785405.1 GNAT family N-acetyltransferase [Bacillus glycinifermentans]NUJ15729.1 GNAT N-acetyltransferase [Bacillus glycinifermentans]
MLDDSKIINLRYSTVKDLEFVCRLEADQENARFIIPWSIDIHKKALEDKDILHLIIEERLSHEPVGYMIIAGLKNPNKSLELRRITIAKKGMGYGKEAFRIIKNWAFHVYNANRLWLDVKEDNVRAFHLYQKQGFVLEGTLRECIKNGDGYDSLHVMSILRREYTE